MKGWLSITAALLLFGWIVFSNPSQQLAFAEEPLQPSSPTLYFFWAENCPHCAKAKIFLDELQRKYPQLPVERYEIWNHRENFQRLLSLAERFGNTAITTPAIAYRDQLWYGFLPDTARQIEDEIRRTYPDDAPVVDATDTPDTGSPTIPLLGRVDDQEHSIAVLALVLGGLDSFNPCAFFVLLFLLSLLIHAHSRRRMLLVGCTFVCFSGLIYFLFMAAWLNLFLLAGHLSILTSCAGALAVLISLFNIKDFFFFKQGVTLSIPEQAKPKLFARMRRLVGTDSLATVLFGTVVLAIAANSYELLCTAGFPMVFTRLLTIQQLAAWQHYAYLALYNLIYVLPLLAITITFSWTLGSHKLSEREGRLLKLVSGLMMLQLGLALLWKPELLHSMVASVLMLTAALLFGALIALTTHLCRRTGRIPPAV